MITFTSGDILHADAVALVNTVNCVGVMGRGVALQFKNAFPANFKAYAAACKAERVVPGKMFVFETGSLHNPRYIINFPTKVHWRAKSRIEHIDEGLRDLVRTMRELRITSIAVPPLGSGLGGLDWALVRSRIAESLAAMPDVEVLVFEPSGSPTAVNRSTDAPAMTAGRAALVTLMERYLAGLLDPFVSLLEVHKLMYFMQAAGEPLRLNFVKGPYGPYAENLRHVLTRVEGHLVYGYLDGGDEPTKELHIVPGADAAARAFLADEPESRSRLERVSELVEGFESPSGLELLATVHWVATNEGGTTPDAALAGTHAWNDRKQRFSRRQVTIALDTLAKFGWIHAAQSQP
ncbi:MAG: macro domain-containing protein [Chloroflexota bacterium]